MTTHTLHTAATIGASLVRRAIADELDAAGRGHESALQSYNAAAVKIAQAADDGGICPPLLLAHWRLCAVELTRAEDRLDRANEAALAAGVAA